ncbi:CDP-alcohol phosphatidyltransferase-like enzyme [Algoriphagus ratkowskyi]|uniref:CDP-alcohol phosphatidyltransferase family protein n=1 Tax=Algoriphagus ratkowskyi TaxID=57028 RepID=A0A2W7R7Y7_9BACT|nr:CDP-alcohol phosphatidyltransferase family protein [Algoriphagus ratkowskyi]PZX56963.1 CDP-alcohol phosphatidyltransferase-like enzyme [Algoriphagus ratkowskyi]TXD79872.1 CDP-alcohol phosphatidyltransferase family protein [Algoriphagus ratkowskyi]
MSKLAEDDRFLDLSDYGRAPAKIIARAVQFTFVTPIHLTVLFGISGLLAIFSLLNEWYIFSALLLLLKSVLDAADGELSRIKETPSHTGRYLDSIFDIILNLLIFIAISYSSEINYGFALLAFICIQFQGTLYNYYYVILRNKRKGGDGTSRIFENKAPRAFPNESQKRVNIYFTIFYFLYSVFDKGIYLLDPEATKVRTFPAWFMTIVSVYGLGFQLLIIAVMLSLGYMAYIIPFFIGYSIFLVVFSQIRKKLL